jgi:predicted dehydrogenase
VSKLRVGIVGSSFGGSVHAPAFASQGRFDVVAIASPNSAAEVAAERKIPQAFTSTQEMIETCKLDVLSIASPPFDHKPAVLAGLGAGLHILCEKPFTLNVADAEELVDASKRAGTVCAIAHEFRYTPARIALRELVANEHLGPLRALTIELSADRLRSSVERAPSWWFERKRGGGITGAILSHLVDQATHVLGRPPLRSTGYERTAVPDRPTSSGTTFASDVADGAFVTIDYGDAIIATVSVDFTRIVESYVLAIHGETRTAIASGENLLDVATFVIDAEEEAELELRPQEHANLRTAHANLPAFVTLLDAFASAIDGKDAELPTFAEALNTQRVLASIGFSVD